MLSKELSATPERPWWRCAVLGHVWMGEPLGWCEYSIGCYTQVPTTCTRCGASRDPNESVLSCR